MMLDLETAVRLALKRHKTQGLALNIKKIKKKKVKCQSTVSVSLRQPANFPMHGPIINKIRDKEDWAMH